MISQAGHLKTAPVWENASRGGVRRCAFDHEALLFRRLTGLCSTVVDLMESRHLTLKLVAALARWLPDAGNMDGRQAPLRVLGGSPRGTSFSSICVYDRR